MSEEAWAMGQRRSGERVWVSLRACTDGAGQRRHLRKVELQLTEANSFVSSPANLASAFNPSTPVSSNSYCGFSLRNPSLLHR